MQYGQYISGAFRPGTCSRVFQVINPSDESVLGEYAYASRTDLEAAVAAAKQSFGAWKKLSSYARSQLLHKVSALLVERKDVIAQTIALELGKPYAEAQREVLTAAEMFDWAAEEARRIYGRTIPARTPNTTQQVVFEPIGVVAAFSGWNAPAITPARKISGALSAGCTIVIKPSEETAGVALHIAHAVHDAGIPAGVVNLVFGEPGEIADFLCDAPDVAMVTFTGATSIGKLLGAKAARTMKKATLELGGHAPVIVCDDVDAEKVARMAVAAKYRNAGQVCTSPTRFMVQRGIFERFKAAFVAAAQTIQVGSPMDAASQMGPLKNQRRLDAIDALVRNARELGCEIACGGHRLEGAGYFYAPTAIIEPGLKAQASNLEPFGPLALITPFDTIDEAIAEANRLPFGLAAYTFTQSLHTSDRFANEIESGVVCINEFVASLPETPFGGYKDSGLGSEGGIEGTHEFLKLKTVRRISVI